jgi:alkylation response protein AidB-like acyl-CoA dehydrogenase
MAIAVTNAEMMISRACQAIDSQEKGWQSCSRAAAVTIAETAAQATTDGIQLLGGVGYMKDFGQEKRFRDAKHIQALLGIAPMKKIRFIENMIT